MRAYLSVSCLVLLSQTFVPADTLTLGSTNASAGSVLQLPFNFTNSNQIVGIQFDLAFPTSLVNCGNAVSTAAGLTVESREIGSGLRRVLVYSPTNEVLPNNALTNIPLTLLPTTPSGGPTVTVRNLIVTNRIGQTFTPTLNYPALDAWRQQHFTEAELDEANLIGDDKDPDGDGIPNLLEFLEGANPRHRQAGAAPVIVPANPGDGMPAALSIVFNVQKGTDAGSLRVETSTDLQTWTKEGIALVPTGASTAQTMEVRASVPIAGAAKRFLRLAGSREPGTVSFFGTNGIQQALALDFNAVDAWRQSKFTPAQLADPIISANSADPDGDGVSNLMEFHTGTDPLLAGSVARSEFAMTTATDGSRKVTFTFRASRELINGGLNVQTSATLGNWNDAAVQFIPTGQSDATSMEFKVEFPVNAEAMFFRLRGQQ